MDENMDIPKDRKMTFAEYLAYEETDDRNTIDISWVIHYKKHLSKMLDEKSTKEHYGDCTKQPCPCNLCTLETILREYKEYWFT